MLDTLCYITINNQRYGLRLPYEIIYTEPTNPKAHINHNFYWNSLSSIQIKRNSNKIMLHSTSNIICSMPELYPNLNFALSSCAMQTPTIVKSKKSVAAFGVMKKDLMGAIVTLRKRYRMLFCYKWSFLLTAIANLNTKISNRPNIIGTYFTLFELSTLDYKATQFLPGLNITFDQTNHLKKTLIH